MEATLGPRSVLGALHASTAQAVGLDAAHAARLQEIAALLLPEAEAIATEVNARAIAAEPALVDREDPTWVDAVAQSSRANVGAILAMLTYGVPGEATAPADGALKLFERLAEHDDGLAVVLRGYRIGIMELWQIWAAHLAEHARDAAELHVLQAASTAFMLTYVDRISSQLCEQWAETRRRQRHGLDVAPEDLIRAALMGHAADLSPLGYALDGEHVALAIDPALDDARVAQLVSGLRVEAAADVVTLRLEQAWIVWLGTAGGLDDVARRRVLERLAAQGCGVGIGQSAGGPDGFVATHREALDARRVGLLRHDSGVTLHRDVALLAILCADTDRARALARAELGPLASDDVASERLRETLHAFLAGGESQVAAAQELGVHQKTIAYRLRRVEELLDRTIGERRAELEAALLLHRAFDGAI